MAGIIHAANAAADVIKMSLGAYLLRRDFLDENEIWAGANEGDEQFDDLGRAMTLCVPAGNHGHRFSGELGLGL